MPSNRLVLVTVLVASCSEDVGSDTRIAEVESFSPELSSTRYGESDALGGADSSSARFRSAGACSGSSSGA